MAPLQNIPPWAIAIIICLLIATFTECTSNVATATLFLPVLASMVSSLTVKKIVQAIAVKFLHSVLYMLNWILPLECSIETTSSRGQPVSPFLVTHRVGHSS